MEMKEVKTNSISEIENLIYAKSRGILVHTFEESRFEDDMRRLLIPKGYELFTYTLSSGLKNLGTNEVQKISDPIRLLNEIEEHQLDSVFIVKDFHEVWKNNIVNRKIRDFLEKRSKGSHVCIVFVSPVLDIPIELEKLINFVEYDLPSKKDISMQIDFLNDYMETMGLELLEGKERESVENALVGMTLHEAVFSLKKSLIKNNKIVLDDINNEKEETIRKTGLLEYITKLEGMDNIGGLDILKTWLDDSYYTFNADAEKYHIEPPKGIILSGFPGSGKSLTAKSIASSWNLPLLKMEMSSIMDSKVGQSEKNIYRALKLAESVSPCVLWIDEIEKSLAGATGPSGDSGTTSRVFSTILTWMSDKESPVFVVATANNITSLPPEITRAGRFDDIFYLGVPGFEERKEILEIHLTKRGYNISDSEAEGSFTKEDISEISKMLEGYTGAEIEQVVKNATRKKFAKFVKGKYESHFIDYQDLEDAIKEVIPLSKRDPELLGSLREWAKHSATFASSEEHKRVYGEGDAIDSTIDDMIDSSDDINPFNDI